MRYLTLNEILHIHRKALEQHGGMPGIRDWGLLEASLGRPKMTFELSDLYPTLVAKAAALGASLIQNHPFNDGNKRVGHAATEIFLMLNGYEISAPIDEQETVILQVAAGRLTAGDFTSWLQNHVTPFKSD